MEVWNMINARVFLCICILGFIPALAHPTVLNVPSDHATIMGAVVAAINGDEVVIAPGTYHEGHLNFQKKAITIRSTNPDDPVCVSQTIIDGENTRQIFNIRFGEGPGSILEGLTLRRGFAGEGVIFGGGISISGSSPTIRNCRLAGCKARYGGGIYCYESSAILEGNFIGACEAELAGGGICASGTVTIRDNALFWNAANNQGGGIQASGHVTIIRNDIIANRSSHGAGISCTGMVSGDISHNIICRNAGVRWGECGIGMGGGIYCAASNIRIHNNTIAYNSADWGGGVHTYNSQVSINSCIIAFSPEGGGLYLREGAPPAVTYTNVFGNAMTGGAGHDYVNMGSLIGIAGNTSVDPLFADPDTGNGDYHLKSRAGRWNPNVAGYWVADEIHSPCIDAGDPAFEFGNEPALNGGRINMGAYGNTSQASKTGTIKPVPMSPRPLDVPLRPRTPITLPQK